MKYILKYSPELTIKSRPVRVRLARQLRRNLKHLLKRVHADIETIYHWDFISVETPELAGAEHVRVEEVLENTPGISTISRVRQYQYTDLDSMFQFTLPLVRDRLVGKTFAVRCKRAGNHSFSSVDVERYVGGGLNQHAGAAGVSLSSPEELVQLEVRDELLYVVEAMMTGLGGFPIGTQDAVLSLISGGFDSSVASFMSMRRGLTTHFCFFNLGGLEHEIAVKEIALYLWLRFGASQRVKFISVPFEGVVAEILENIGNSQMGVVLKRMMLRAASKLAQELEIDALVTGESVAQVSSQTLRNLSVIDRVTDTLVLRPLAMSDKQEIVDTARRIGTEEFSAVVPEYCGVISIRPTTRARLERIEHEESRFDFSVLEQAVAERQVTFVDEFRPPQAAVVMPDIFPEVPAGAVVVDIRHPAEVELKPLQLNHLKAEQAGDTHIEHLPFYKLHKNFSALDQGRQYLLYCDRGVMSKLHASYLKEQGFNNIGVYRP